MGLGMYMCLPRPWYFRPMMIRHMAVFVCVCVCVSVLVCLCVCVCCVCARAHTFACVCVWFFALQPVTYSLLCVHVNHDQFVKFPTYSCTLFRNFSSSFHANHHLRCMSATLGMSCSFLDFWLHIKGEKQSVCVCVCVFICIYIYIYIYICIHTHTDIYIYIYIYIYSFRTWNLQAPHILMQRVRFTRHYYYHYYYYYYYIADINTYTHMCSGSAYLTWTAWASLSSSKASRTHMQIAH